MAVKAWYTKLSSWVETALICQNKFFTCRMSVCMCMSLWHCSERSPFSLIAGFFLLTLESKIEKNNKDFYLNFFFSSSSSA